jgi:hypothetical protein
MAVATVLIPPVPSRAGCEADRKVGFSVFGRPFAGHFLTKAWSFVEQMTKEFEIANAEADELDIQFSRQIMTESFIRNAVHVTVGP